MTHAEKVDYLINDLSRKGYWRSTISPPLYRVLWQIGIEFPPPLFLGFLTMTVMFGIPFGVFFGAWMWFFHWQNMPRMTGEEAIWTSVASGLLFGVSLAGYYRWHAWRLKLPNWNDYPVKVPAP